MHSRSCIATPLGEKKVIKIEDKLSNFLLSSLIPIKANPNVLVTLHGRYYLMQLLWGGPFKNIM
jgi:hypothetical protein